MKRIRRGLPGALICLALTGAGAARAGDADLPWSTGDSGGGGWIIEGIQRHPEFIRLRLQRDAAETCVEIRYKEPGDPADWSSRRYRIQPCPEGTADEPLLCLLLGRLRDWERKGERVPFVQKVSRFSRGKGAQDDSTEPGDFYPSGFYLLLNGAALLLFLVLLYGWLLRFPRDRRVVLPAAALAAGALALLLCAGDPSRVPAGWVTVLHEGYGYQNIMQLYGYGVHAGPNFHVLQELWAGGQAGYGGGVVLRATLFVNIGLAMVNIIFFFAVARLVSGKSWAALLSAFLLAANLNFLHATVSETPAQLLCAYFLMGVLSAAHLNSGGKTGRAAACLAMLELGLLGFLLCATRIDMIVLAVPAGLAGLVQLFSRGSRYRRRLGDLWRWSLRQWRWLLPASLAVAAASTIWWAGYHYPGDPRVGWAIDGLFPFNPSFLTPPRFLAVYLPLGLVLLIVLGTIDAFRRPFRTFFLPLSLLVLWRVYYSATHGYGGPFYERFRFMTYLTPLFILLAVFGFRELGRWIARVPWLRSRTRLAAVLLGLTFLIWWPPGWGGYFDSGHELENLPRSRLLLSRNQQTEVRYLLDLMDRYPECAFITRTIKYGNQGKPGYIWGLFGKKVRTDLFYHQEGETLDQVAAERAAEYPCALFYHGLDCNKQSGDRCREQIENLQMVEEHLLSDLPYTDFHGKDSHPPIIRLAVFWAK